MTWTRDGQGLHIDLPNETPNDQAYAFKIEVNGDAHLGQQQFLRLFAVGVVEDEPVFQGSHFLTLEITD